MQVETLHPNTIPREVRVRVYKDKAFSKMAYEHYLREEAVLSADSWGMFVHAALKTADYTLGMEGWEGIEIRIVRYNSDTEEFDLVGGHRVLRVGRVQ